MLNHNKNSLFNALSGKGGDSKRPSNFDEDDEKAAYKKLKQGNNRKGGKRDRSKSGMKRIG